MGKKNYTSFDGGPCGYRRPPVEFQFKPGQRAKGAGRRKGCKNYETLVKEILEKKVPVMENGKRKMVPAKKALLMKALASAINGKSHDIIRFYDLVHRLAPALVEPTLEPIPMMNIPGDDNL